MELSLKNKMSTFKRNITCTLAMGLQEEAGSLTTELLKGVLRSTPPCTGNTQALAQAENQAGDLS